MTAQAFPLTWPESWPRTTSRGKSQFKTSLEGAIRNVESSLSLFAKDSGKKVENIMVSSNFQLMSRSPDDLGVAVYFTWDGISTCIAVDRYAKLEENLQAIHHCIEAEHPNAVVDADKYEELVKENEQLKQFTGLWTGFDTKDPRMNAARYDGYLDGVQVGMDGYDSLAAVAGRMAEELLQWHPTSKALNAYNALMKGDRP